MTQHHPSNRTSNSNAASGVGIEASLESLVLQFQSASAATPRDEHLLAELFCEIKKRCEPVTRQVCVAYSNLGSFVADVADEKLEDCIAAFKPPHKFRGLYRTALINRANDEARRRQRMEALGSDMETSADATAFDAEEFDKALEVFAHRKYQLVRVLKSQPVFERSTRLLSTLFIDQRQRAARWHFSLVHYRADKLSCWIERLEKWSKGDAARQLAPREITVGEVWSEYATAIDEDESKVTQSDLLEAIAKAGAIVSLAAWRQRVCRYLDVVRDEVDESEWYMFYPSS